MNLLEPTPYTKMPYKDPNDPRRKASTKRSSAKYYADNKKKAISANSATRKKNRELWQAFKAGLKCEKCGFSHPAALDFHHVDRTDKKSVNKLAGNGMYKQAVQELSKCVVLCANCHRTGHFYEQRGLPENLHDMQSFKKWFRI